MSIKKLFFRNMVLDVAFFILDHPGCSIKYVYDEGFYASYTALWEVIKELSMTGVIKDGESRNNRTRGLYVTDEWREIMIDFKSIIERFE